MFRVTQGSEKKNATRKLGKNIRDNDRTVVSDSKVLLFGRGSHHSTFVQRSVRDHFCATIACMALIFIHWVSVRGGLG
jgi:hypothetical protein